MKIRIFNPEHDIALALNRPNVTPPHAARQLQTDFDFLPALFADDGDYILVGDSVRARTHYEHACVVSGKEIRDVNFITSAKLSIMAEECSPELQSLTVLPWGMDDAVLEQFRQLGTDIDISTERLEKIRNLSSRHWCVDNLQDEAEYITDVSVLRSKISELRRCVLKSPWSSSGRGVRYIDLDAFPNASAAVFSLEQSNWVAKIIRMQGGIVLEPFYNKVMDFGMEFKALPSGEVRYCGLSLFQTEKRAYTGSLLACEEDKQDILSQYVDVEEQQKLATKMIRVISPATKNVYEGPLGVDFMVVKIGNTDKLVVKTAEMNLRCTMGHVALALSPTGCLPPRLMRTEYDGGHYHLRIKSKMIEEI
nr:hypothetical protein [Prevotella sp.]